MFLKILTSTVICFENTTKLQKSINGNSIIYRSYYIGEQTINNKRKMAKKLRRIRCRLSFYSNTHGGRDLDYPNHTCHLVGTYMTIVFLLRNYHNSTCKLSQNDR